MNLNSVQLKSFKELILEINQKQIDVRQKDKLYTLQQFNICKNFLSTICKTNMLNKKNTHEQRIDDYLQEMLIQFINKKNSGFNSKLFVKLIENMLNYQVYEQNKIYYFSPIYNLEFDGNEILLDEFIKIRKISKDEMNYLKKFYEGFVPIQIDLLKIKYVFIICIDSDAVTHSSTAHRKIFEVINKFRLLKTGAIVPGGLYAFDKSENWNPYNKFTRIEIEPVGKISRNTYSLKNTNKKKFYTLLDKINKRYPASNMDELDHERYEGHFENIIHEFNEALSKINKSMQIVYLVLTLEILLVNSPGDSTMKLAQRTALFIGRNDEEKKEIYQHMIVFYNFRSGQLHELIDRTMKTDSGKISKNEAMVKLEQWARRAILQMIIYSQDGRVAKLNKKDLCRKIDESMFSKSLNLQFLKLSKTVLNLLNC